MTEATPEKRHGILLPEDPALVELLDHGRERFFDVVTTHPSSSLVWALLAEGALSQDTPDGIISGYAFARTGYQYGIDALRQSGWRGFGPIPWEHEPNQGFLRSTWLLAGAALRLGHPAEAQRCVELVRESSVTAYDVLSATRPIAGLDRWPSDQGEQGAIPADEGGEGEPGPGSIPEAEAGLPVE